MTTVVIGVASRDEANTRFVRAMSGEKQGNYRSFETVADLWRTLTPKRLELLRVMTGAGALSLREVARRVGRDVKGVHTDVHLLLNGGLLDKTENGEIIFPFDAVHVDFLLKAA